MSFSPSDPTAHALSLHAALAASSASSSASPSPGPSASLLISPRPSVVVRAALREPSLAPFAAARVAGALLANGDPGPALTAVRTRIADTPAAKSGVCGTVWRKDELAYKCKTCERDPTCAICVKCFRNGNHEGHDYAMIRTAGGCCDCGDVQAWKPEGFCKFHGGASAESDDPAVGMDDRFVRDLKEVSGVVADEIRLACIRLREATRLARVHAANGLRREAERIVEEERGNTPRDGGGINGRGGQGAGGNPAVNVAERRARERRHEREFGPFLRGLNRLAAGGAFVLGGGRGGGGAAAAPAGAVGQAANARGPAAPRPVTATDTTAAGVTWGTGTAGTAEPATDPPRGPRVTARRSSADPDVSPHASSAASVPQDVLLADIRRVRVLLRWLGDLVECGDGVRRVVAVQLAKSCEPGDGVPGAGAASGRRPWLECMLQLDGCDQLPPPVQRALHALYYQLVTDLVFKRAFLELFASNYERFINLVVRKKSLPQYHPEYSPPDMDSMYPDEEDGDAGEDGVARGGGDEDDGDGGGGDGGGRGGSGEREPRSDILESFSVQLFTVPALIPVIMRDGGVLDILLGILLSLFETAARPVQKLRSEAWGTRGDVNPSVSGQAQTPRGPSTAGRTAAASPVSSAAASAASAVPFPASLLPADVLANPDQFGPLHPINEITFEAAFGLKGESFAEYADVREAVRRAMAGPWTHGVGIVYRADVDDTHGDDDEAQDDREEEDGEVERDEEREEEGDGEEQVALVEVEADAGVARHLNPLQAHPDQEQEQDHLNDEDGDMVDDGDFDEDIGAEIAMMNDLVEEEGDVGMGALLTDDVPNAAVGVGMGVPEEDGFVHDFNRQGNASIDLSIAGAESDTPVAEARWRFLAIIDARRRQAAALEGTGPLLHPMRVEWQQKQPIVEFVCWSIVRDLRYVLTHVQVAVHLVHCRPDLLRLFVRLLSLLQGMNPSRRQVGDHVTSDVDTWAKAYTLEIEFFHIVELLVCAFCHDPPADSKLTPQQSRARAASIVRECLDEWLDREEQTERGNPDNYDVASGVSVHLPLHRLLSIFNHHMVRLDGTDLPVTVCGGRQASRRDAVHVARRTLRHPLRIQSFLAQVQAGMWRRNGRAVVGQSMLYRAVVCAEWFVDLDIFMLQQCLVVIGPEEFASRVISTFALQPVLDVLQKVNLPTGLAGGSWLASDPDRPSTAVASQLGEYDPSLVESMITLFVHVTTERARCGLSDKDALRRKFLHRLCVQDQTHSHLLRTCPQWVLQSRAPADNFAHVAPVAGVDESDGNVASIVQTTLNAIADFSQPRDMEQGRFRLKDQSWEEFDMFLPHLTLRERAAAEDRYAVIRSRQKQPPHVIPVKTVASRPLYPPFVPVLELLTHLACGKDSVIGIIFRRCLQTGGVRALEAVLPPSLHIAVAAVETTEECSGEASVWLNELTCGSSFLGSVLDSAAQMYAEARADSGPHFHECRLAITRLLQGAYVRSGRIGKEKLHSVAPQLLASPDAGRGSRREGLESPVGDRSGDRGADEESPASAARKRMLKMKKAQQAAAMERMRAAQAKFAAAIGDVDANLGSGSTNDVPSGASGSGVAQATNAGESDQNKVTDERLNDSSVIECQVKAPASLISGHVCALCRNSEEDAGAMALVGFAQETRIPYMAAQNNTKWAAGSSAGASETVFHSETEGDASMPDIAPRMTKKADAGHSGAGPSRLRDEGLSERLSQARSSLATGGVAKDSRSLPPDGDERRVSGIDDHGLDWAVLKGGIDGSPGVHIGFCGHSIHIGCFQRYFASLQQSQVNNDLFEGHNLISLANGEFLCPVCRRMANLMLPLVPGDLREFMPDVKPTSASPGDLSTEGDVVSWAHNAFDFPGQREISDTRIVDSNHQKEDGLFIGQSLIGSEGRFSSTSVDGHSPWSHAKFALSRFLGASSPGIAEAKPRPAHEMLCEAAGTTIVSAEIAARSGAWDESTLRSRIGTLVRQARVWSSEQQKSGSDTAAAGEVWRSLIGESEALVEPFAAVLFLLFRWPGRLSELDVKNIVWSGYLASVVRAELVRADVFLASLLYLRRASILVGCIYDQDIDLRSYPEDRTPLGNGDVCAEHLSLTTRLNLPDPGQALATWRAGGSIMSLRSRILPSISLIVPRRFSLMTLPLVFQELLEFLDGRKCDSCKETPRRAALCLVCARLFCSTSGATPAAPPSTGFSHACRGWAKAHAKECGSGVGVFLILKTTNVCVYRNNRVASWGSPYLDEHGEEDNELRRGKPLHLSKQRYAALERLWLSHGFDHDARTLSHTMLGRFFTQNDVWLE